MCALPSRRLFTHFVGNLFLPFIKSPSNLLSPLSLICAEVVLQTTSAVNALYDSMIGLFLVKRREKSFHSVRLVGALTSGAHSSTEPMALQNGVLFSLINKTKQTWIFSLLRARTASLWLSYIQHSASKCILTTIKNDRWLMSLNRRPRDDISVWIWLLCRELQQMCPFPTDSNFLSPCPHCLVSHH